MLPPPLTHGNQTIGGDDTIYPLSHSSDQDHNVYTVQVMGIQQARGTANPPQFMTQVSSAPSSWDCVVAPAVLHLGHLATRAVLEQGAQMAAGAVNPQ